MKTIKYLLAALTMSSMMTACDTDIESIEIQKPLTYDDQYYENLREWKASDHSISFGWFAQYGAQNSAGIRFMGLPDSLDICSLWGGIPQKGTECWNEMKFVQKVKGTKILSVAITRLDSETNDKPFKKAYLEAQAMEHGPEKTAALNRAIEMYAEYFLDGVFLNDLDGFDADCEPDGDFLQGSYFAYFMRYLSKYLGPGPDITKEERLKLIEERYGKEIASQEGVADKMLCVDSDYDSSASAGSISHLVNYYFIQAYGGGTGNGGWPIEKCVFCCNMGDGWQGEMKALYDQASYQPENGKRKGGFGAFFIHRDYNVNEYNPEPYYRFRQCIQIQNPAIY